jgi:hypothetical protein
LLWGEYKLDLTPAGWAAAAAVGAHFNVSRRLFRTILDLFFFSSRRVGLLVAVQLSELPQQVDERALSKGSPEIRSGPIWSWPKVRLLGVAEWGGMGGGGGFLLQTLRGTFRNSSHVILNEKYTARRRNLFFFPLRTTGF